MAASAQSPLPPGVSAIPHELRPVIRPIGKTTAPHVSTPHSTTATTTKAAPPWLNSAALTQKQMDAQATSEANASIAPQVTGMQQQQQQYDAQQKAYEAAMTGFYSALAPYMAGIRGQVSDAYNSAGATMGGIAHGYAGTLGASAQANADATTAALTRAGQTQAIPAAQAQANPGSALTDAFSATHGGIAGASFAEQGAAKAADAAQKPAIWAAQGRDSMTEAINKAVAGDQNYANQIKNIYATVPALRDSILKQIQSAELDKAKYAADQKNTAFDQAYKTHEAALGDAKFNASQSNTAFNQKATIARINLESQKAARSAYQSDRTYQIQLANLGIRQKNAQLRAVAQEYKLKNGGFTPVQLARYDSLLQQGLDTLPAGTTYGQFVAKAVEHGVPVSLAVDRANSHWPATQRPAPGELSSLLGISASTAASDTGFNAQMKAYNQTVGAAVNGKVTLATGPRGQQVQLQMPRKVTPAIRTIVNGAVEYLGTPYAWGGESPSGFDCSGLAQYLYGKAGVQIPRTTYEQFQSGVSVPRNQLQAGDLVFFKGSDSKGGLPGHVGIYVGAGQFIEAPHTGDVVKVSKLAGYPGYQGARRYGG